jgi:voltage-gated potassium channel
MLTGYGTGIVTVELAKAARTPVSTRACLACGHDGHDTSAVPCKFCGAGL